jgi:acyl carrier protein
MEHKYTRQQVECILCDIIQKIANDNDVYKIEQDLPLRDQLDMDSMDFLDFIREIKIKLNVEVPAEDFPKLQTLRSAILYLQSKF